MKKKNEMIYDICKYTDFFQKAIEEELKKQRTEYSVRLNYEKLIDENKMFLDDDKIKKIFEENDNTVSTYIRYGKSIDSKNYKVQEKIIDSFCKKYNLKIHKKYEDAGYSGASNNRPAFNTIINQKDTKIIVASETEKLNRNFDLKRIEELAKEKNKIFIFALSGLIIGN